MRSRGLIVGVLLGCLAETAPVFADMLSPVIDDSSQTADLGNDDPDRAVIDDSSQAADLGNDAVDWAPITDESQAADLH